jgi:superfamily II DNA or RNA helicase
MAVPDSILTAIRPGPPVSGSAVAAAVAQSLAPPEAGDAPPEWLYPEQVRSFRRALDAIRRYGGAVLADPVGSGKTYVALAIAAALNRGRTACLVPAPLIEQWKRVAALVNLPVAVCSHQQVSRGHLPQQTRGLVVIDESHHFRNPGTHRYAHLAPWLIGRPALLLTATPVVNRIRDLAHQLLLTVRDDALVMEGIVSLQALLARGCSAPALGRVIIENDPATGRRPRRVPRVSRPTEAESRAMRAGVEMVGRLRLSRTDSIAGLLRGVFLRAGGSSPAALAGALRRYRRLLLHARDALEVGQRLDRSELRRFTAELGDQLIWWELIPRAETASELELSDLCVLDGLIQATSAAVEGEDGKLARLRDILRDGAPTLVFVACRDTVRYLRDRLADLRVAWCAGNRAGIGSAPLPRSTVLAWFRHQSASSLAPQHLIVTDVAAEGLDLHRAARVVHYDLPWTPMRLEQREGRSVRYGSLHSEVEVVRFLPPPVLERCLRIEGTLARKAQLPTLIGLGPAGRHIWRWRSELADRFDRAEAFAGTAAIDCPHEGMLAGFSLHQPSDGGACLSSAVIWLEPDGTWSEAPEVLAAWLARAAQEHRVTTVPPDALKKWLALLADPIRERLGVSQSRRWIAPEPVPAARRLSRRLQALIGAAARKHDPARLTALERALSFVAGGHTAGEAGLVERLAESSDGELAGAVEQLPYRRGQGDGLEVRLIGLIVFGPQPSTVP